MTRAKNLVRGASNASLAVVAAIQRVFGDDQLDFLSWAEKVRFGGRSVLPRPFASGSAVLANDRALKGIKTQHRQIIAFDMEAYGVCAAAWDACQPGPCSLVLKGVVDYGDEEKSDEFREYSGYVCAEVFAAFVAQEYPNLLDLWKS